MTLLTFVVDWDLPSGGCAAFERSLSDDKYRSKFGNEVMDDLRFPGFSSVAIIECCAAREVAVVS